MSWEIETKGADATRALGEAIGEAVTQPLAIVLRADYGAGKTTFVQGLARGLGIRSAVRSPSYSIIRSYDGRLRLVHVDLYRASSTAEIDELGIDELLGERGVLALEWPPEGYEAELEIPALVIRIEVIGEEERKYTIETMGSVEKAAMEVLDAACAG